MTLPEYLYRMKAYNLSKIDKERDMHWQAWLNTAAGSTVQKGNDTFPKYKNFDEFFVQKKYEEMFSGEENKPVISNQQKRMAQIAAHLNK